MMLHYHHTVFINKKNETNRDLVSVFIIKKKKKTSSRVIFTTARVSHTCAMVSFPSLLSPSVEGLADYENYPPLENASGRGLGI